MGSTERGNDSQDNEKVANALESPNLQKKEKLPNDQHKFRQNN
jgi:hypothetical protein